MTTKKVDIKMAEVTEKFADYLGYKEALLQYLRAFRSNQRQGTQATKTRAEVSGGGRKPFKQKGTGRARAGSSRNPVWVHGGVSHGPNPRSWRLALTKSTKTKALFTALASKFLENNVLVLEDFSVNKPQTNIITKLLKDLELHGKTVFITSVSDTSLKKSISNTPHASYVISPNLNAYDIVSHKNIVMTKAALEILVTKANL